LTPTIEKTVGDNRKDRQNVKGYVLPLKKVVQPHNPLDWSAADTGNHNPYFHEGRIN